MCIRYVGKEGLVMEGLWNWWGNIRAYKVDTSFLIVGMFGMTRRGWLPCVIYGSSLVHTYIGTHMFTFVYISGKAISRCFSIADI
jgi:hypothetical protein